MPRVVIDPNVLISALINPGGPPAELVQAWRDGFYEMVVCPELVAEVRDVVRRPKIAERIDDVAAAEFLAALPVAARNLPDPPARPGATRDPEDDYLIALAIEDDADLIVSGDAAVLDEGVEGPLRLSPRAALQWLHERP